MDYAAKIIFFSYLFNHEPVSCPLSQSIAMNWSKLIFIIFGISHLSLTAQTDSLPQSATDLLENVAQDAETESVDDNTIFDALEAFRQNPLNLNLADDEELHSLRLLTDIQIQNILNYRELNGPFIAIYELQAVPQLDLETIRNILPFVQIKSDFRDYHIARKALFGGGKNQLLFRWNRTFPLRKGYIPKADTLQPAYLGDPNRYYFRYRYQYDNRLSYGLTAEKDPGEPFFKDNNKSGFDFYSFHFFAYKTHPRFKAIALGDYQLNLGQGLIYYSGFAPGKSAFVMSIRRSSPILRPFASVREAQFLRGAATTLKINDKTELTAFASFRHNDANISEPDTLDPENEIYISSLLISGLHRTKSEIEDKNTIKSTIVGAALRRKEKKWQITFNSLYEHLSAHLKRNPKPYNRFYFQGNRLFNHSIDYSFSLRKFYFFGESAVDQNGTSAHVTGLLTGLTRYTDLALLYRHFPKGYESLHAASFAETNGTINEQGLYVGLDIRPIRQWTISMYHDIWHHPWLRFKVDAPSSGNESLIRVRYYLRRNLELYLQARKEVKETNLPKGQEAIHGLGFKQLYRYRIHFSKKISRALELRTRAEWSKLRLPGIENPESGFLLYQDFIYHPWENPFSMTARIAFFDTDSYASGIYAYENNMLYTFSIPSYYEKGMRTYLNLRYRPFRPWTFEFRWAATLLSNQNEIGSGNDLINSRLRTDLGLQIRYIFGGRR
ncbi:MAG TPA: helix-hairpin-helix domain-containing protein [Saprospiraceae bacterium]|nr:helix-hairpin-helix domain-containing protein [Saprospiraceae bacterium]